MILKGGKVLNKNFIFEKEKDLYIKNGKITDAYECDEVIDVTELTVIPGLIDTHIHGYGGKNMVTNDVEELNFISEELLKQGITSFLATTTTLPKEDLIGSINTINKAMESGTDGAEILGIYMEGPYICMKYKGGMMPSAVREFSKDEFDSFVKAGKGNIKIITIAPDIEENFKHISDITDSGIIASIGHTDADGETVDKSIEQGISTATHLFNAMKGLHHREPGVVGAVLDSNITAELICDGYHVNQKAIRMVFKVLGKDRVIMISDAIPNAGMPEGEYIFEGRTVIIKDGTCKLLDGTINGNINSLFECMRRVVKFGIPLEDAVYCSSYTPAKRLGIESQKGSIEPGKDADLVVMDDYMNIKYVIKNGIIKYKA